MNKYLVYVAFGFFFLTIQLHGSFPVMDPFLSKLLSLQQSLDNTNPLSKTQEHYQALEKILLREFKSSFGPKAYQDLDKKRKETFLLDCEESSYLFCMSLLNKKNLKDSDFLRRVAYLRYGKTITTAQQIIVQRQVPVVLIEHMKRD